MRPSRNAFLGYSYQQLITFLMIVKMDVEREIKEIEIEVPVDNNFDDIKILKDNTTIYCQIKDIDAISYSDLKIKENHIIINGKSHKLSKDLNLLFFKKIDVTPNTKIFGLPAFKKANIAIICLSRKKAGTIVSNLYKYNENRESIVSQFFNAYLDERLLRIKQEELPIIDIYNIHLSEKTINVGKKLLECEDILFIEGKPGVGKSHLVTCLMEEHENCIVYRFWVSNQDKDYEARLIFRNFLTNISKELFQDYRYRTEDEVIDYLNSKKKTVIIDGFDHVENYQKNELNSYVNFINKLKGKCKTIVLSRPLKMSIEWTKQQLVNWNYKETERVLSELYHISDYTPCHNIFDITDGYPILVRFVTEHYKKYNEMPVAGKLNDIEEYYEKITSNSNTQSALCLFLSTRSFIMKSEILLFLENELSEIVKEFIKSYPYLFEIRLNRISLFHDSLNTYLRNKKIDYSQRNSIIKNIVYTSLMNGEKRFMSRFAFFDLDKSMKIEIIKKYVSINYFKENIRSCIDFEAVRVFYKHIRETLTELEAHELEMINYYNLSLIINITARDHISTVNDFLYTYVKSIIFNGYEDDDITSSEHLFGMYYYCKKNDAIFLYNQTANEHYSTEHFYQDLENNVFMEDNYFSMHMKPLRKSEYIKNFINQEPIYDTYKYVPHILANLYLHKTKIKELKELQNAIRTYLDIDENLGIKSLENALQQFKNVSLPLSRTFLKNAKDIILSLGKDFFPNDYHTESLKEIILKNFHLGSFDVWPKVLNYIRLSFYEKRKIDLSSIGYFFFMYTNRKDYTVINIDEALKVFEDKGLMSIDESIDIIVFTQSMSEKGIRYLLRNYIELHSPDIISSVLKKYPPDSLEIIWFDLPKEYINYFPDSLFKYAFSHLFRRSTYSKEIDFNDIHNVFNSNRKTELIKVIKFSNFCIKINSDHPHVKELQNLGCLLSMSDSVKEKEFFENSEERYNQGILDSDDINFIKENKIKAEDVAGYTNGDLSVFADLDVFKAYNKEHVMEKAPLILRNALIGKIQSINMFANLFYFLGNFPKFMNEYDVDINFSDMYKSFLNFLEISLLNKK